jgi:hypothetical protein
MEVAYNVYVVNIHNCCYLRIDRLHTGCRLRLGPSLWSRNGRVALADDHQYIFRRLAASCSHSQVFAQRLIRNYTVLVFFGFPFPMLIAKASCLGSTWHRAVQK